MKELLEALNRITGQQQGDMAIETLQKQQEERRKANDAVIAGLAKGKVYLTMIKGRGEHQITLLDGRVVQASQSASEQMGKGFDAVLDWADRGKIAVFVSQDGGKRGTRIDTRPMVPAGVKSPV